MTTSGTNYQLLKLYLDSIPNFDGNPHTLNIFIGNCESFISAFASNSDNALNTFLYRAIIGKLTGRAQILIGSRTELKTWDEIKQALNLSFGDQRDIDCLVQDLINLKPFKNETPYNFGMRCQDSRSLIISKLNTLHFDPSEKPLHLRNYDNLALKTFVRGLPLPIQTNIRLRSPDSLEKAMSLVVEEENFLYSTQRSSNLNSNVSFKPSLRVTPTRTQNINLYPTNHNNVQPFQPPRPIIPPNLITNPPASYPSRYTQHSPTNPSYSNWRPNNNYPTQRHPFFTNQNYNPIQRPSQSPQNFNQPQNIRPNNPQYNRPNNSQAFKPEPMDISSGNTVLKSHSTPKFTSAELFNQSVDNSDSHDQFYSENPNYYENIDDADINNYYTQETEHSYVDNPTNSKDFYTDYRKLNEKTIQNRYPIPRISEIMDRLGRANYFTSLDLASGFHQIEVDPEDVPKTAFSNPQGHFQFQRMPFGLKNAPSTFQSVMDNVLRGLTDETCIVYLDDILIYSTSLQEHIQRVKQVFDRLRKFNLKIQLDKSEFLQKSIVYLGHIITPEGVKPNPEKISVIKNFPIPKTQTEIKSFLGLLGYYRRFIPNFAKLTKLMTKCLKKGMRIIHDKEFIDSFQNCKEILTNDPILQYPDFSKPMILTTDSSNYSLGAVLSQGTVPNDKPIAHASRTLNDSEINYSTIEKELLAIVWACKHFRPYLYGRQLHIYTDHKALTWLFKLKEPNSKLVRWRLKLEEYDYKIFYKCGSSNVVSDCLNRIQINALETDSIINNPGDTNDEILEFLREFENSLEQENNSINQSNQSKVNIISDVQIPLKIPLI
ncbi:uncharacterized protein LOC130903024 [Diorhabda carinulata]|uniref:uncharacterized protein LOC130903024 n=1 Tax=Diorhabda carinulata TaxID=1163345 RepID=UPI0025A30AF8|nr:uncharacterized protein LOC130903024 [Diorhabda carinulata]